MKRYLILFVMLVCWGMNSAECAPEASGAEGLIGQEVMDSLGVDALNREVANVSRDLAIDLEPLTLDTIHKIVQEGIGVEPHRWMRTVEMMFLHEIGAQLQLLGKVLFLAMLCVLMQQLQSSFESSKIAMLSHSVCFIFLLTIAMKSFSFAVVLASQTIDGMITVMEALLPMLLFLLTAVGAPISAALFTPLIVFAVNAMGIFIQSVVMPLFFLVSVLDAVNCLSASYRVGQLTALLRQAGILFFTLGMTIFTGLLSLQGVSGGIADGLGIRTAKFAVGNLVPIVGKMFADSIDVVFGASLILKNALGVFGIVTIGAICLVPLIKLIVLAFLMKGCAALIQPMGEERLSGCLMKMGSNMMLLFTVVLSVAFLFFLTITIIVGVGAMSVMLR